MKNQKIFFIIILLFVCSNIFSQSDHTTNMINHMKSEGDLEGLVEYLSAVVERNPQELKGKSHLFSNELSNLTQDDDFLDNLYLLILRLVENNLFTINQNVEQKIILLHKELREDFAGAQKDNYLKWIWDDWYYHQNRNEAGILMNLMGFIQSNASISELKLSLKEYNDRRLKLWAATGLIRLNQSVSLEDLTIIAADDETRQSLFSILRQLNKLSLFPSQYKNQEALSKSDMVNWLIHPERLARTPDDIEPLKVFSFNYENIGDVDFYLWKFRSVSDKWNDRGWMVGLSGPFIRKDSPTDVSQGYTYSDFQKLEATSMEGHFKHIVDILEKNK